MQLPQHSLSICTDLYLKADEQKPHVEKLYFAWISAMPHHSRFPPHACFWQSQDAQGRPGTQTHRTLAAPWTGMPGDWVHGSPTHPEGSGSCCPQWCCRICSPGHRCSCESAWRTCATSSSSRAMGLASWACCPPSAAPCLALGQGCPPPQW